VTLGSLSKSPLGFHNCGSRLLHQVRAQEVTGSLPELHKAISLMLGTLHHAGVLDFVVTGWTVIEDGQARTIDTICNISGLGKTKGMACQTVTKE
jgi:hypothetical protein